MSATPSLRRRSARLLAACGGLLLAGATALAGGLDEDAWREASRQARRLRGEPGSRFAKKEVIELLGRDDSLRAADELVDWAARSQKLQERTLRKALDEAQEDLDKIEKILLKAYPKMPPTRAEDKNAWLRLKEFRDAAQEAYETEDVVRYAIERALGGFRDPDTLTWLADEGLERLAKVRASESVQVAVMRAVLQQPADRVRARALELARDAARPKLRILALNWIGGNAEPAGLDALLAALEAREEAVVRAALPALRALDDPRAVEPLIGAMAGADGLLNAEIDDVLHWFTGKSFEGSAAVWKRWWEAEGAAWLAQGPPDRFKRKREALPGGTQVRFYGIPTESHHVVFVLDRSGSMKTKAGDLSIEAKKEEEEPRGPVTGGGDDGGAGGRPGRDAVAGETKMEVARNQLALSLDELPKDVRFALVFYSSKVDVWQEPPTLMDATPSNKAAAKAWFMDIGPDGSTATFDALHKALEYADTIGEDRKKPRRGADTIFLLSDGSPTMEGGQTVLSGEALEEAMATFLKANDLYHCVVHTIGIGPEHNRTFMQRLAQATGGEYKAVGAR